ncbi:TcpQ domain-containing protein [Rahnella sp. BCC 1045]|uniref:PFGI-1 class ICE element type IV pilus protein PilL2 n=1 Tax=Rahnella sp. BCC 1045 TaxID=2816251 RepID=UPI001C27963A|nr:TcpQ domain-containing protein [Rahnella sp. BCC 1045]MBU9819866.1 TcpQ domain-containing protein [Rahnella sp. BCC 1045]
MAQLTLHPGHKLAWLTLSLLTAGCANNGTSSDALSRIPADPRVSDIYQGKAPEVVRYDKYTLVSARPDDAQRDPLNQMVEITMPAQLVRSVGDGFRYLLLESGYSLCPSSSSVFSELLSRPLPAVQRSIGPVRLSEALQVLAGPAWRLRVDDVNREVCFTLRDAYRDFAPKTVTAAYIGNPVTPVIAPRVASDGFLASPSGSLTSGTHPSSALLSAPAQGQPKLLLKPESIPVPSPVLTAMKSGPQMASAVPPGRVSGVSITSSPQAHQPAQALVKPSAPIPIAAVKTAGSVRPLQTVPAVSRPLTHSFPSPAAAPTVPAFVPGRPVIAAPSGQLWSAEVGSTLKETLTRWAGTAKCENGGSWVVIWPVSLDYRIDAPLTFHGNFESVLVQVFDLYRQADKPLYAAASRMQCLVSVSDQPGRN